MTKLRGSVPPREFFEKEARAHLVEGDLFSFKNPVIPIMTRGRAYGSLSRRVVEEGIELPDMGLNCAAFVDPYIFVALWDDAAGYTPERIVDCAAACMRIAAVKLRMEILVMPVLGGKEGFRYLWAAEQGIFEQSDALAAADLEVPDHIFVTDKIPT